jgi:aqualysin 1
MRRVLHALAVALTAGVVLNCAEQPVDPMTSTPVDAASAQFSVSSVNRYIVTLKSGVGNPDTLADQLTRAHGGVLHVVYRHALKGFVLTLPEPAVAALSQHPLVQAIEPDQLMMATITQPNATWGLDRIDQRTLPRNTSYTYSSTGTGVRVYIMDTGIRTTHSEFAGRASVGFDAFGGSGLDCNGHGTHVAGTVAGNTWGVAKAAQVVAVRVLDCAGSGTTSGVIAGIDWVTGNHIKPAVVNMSLAGAASSALDNAVNNSIAAGVTYVVAAGNANANACNSSPARVPAVLTVGSSTKADARSSFSNWGTCLDLFAPGSSITSAWYQSDTQAVTISGTSMASPHVAGAAALYLESYPQATATQVASAIIGAATTGVITSPSGSPNRLLYTVFAPDTSTPPPPPPPPTSPCTATCTMYTGTLSGPGDTEVVTGSRYTAIAGTHEGWLQAGAGTDFDLYLYRYNGSSWSIVAQSLTAGSSSEHITFTGTAGEYRWRVISRTGSGAYSLWVQKP